MVFSIYIPTKALGEGVFKWNPHLTTGYIYITENLLDGKKYIGQHHWEKPDIDPSYYGSGKLLHIAMKKYGKENFVVHVLQWCKTKWDLDSREMAWIRFYDATNSSEFYNITEGGNTNRMVGERNGMYGIKGKDNPNYGRRHTEEELRKMSESQKHKKLSDETRRKISENHADISGEKNPNYGKPMSKEQRNKISKTLTGRSNPRKPKGETNSKNAKLTRDEILKIADLRLQGIKLHIIAKMFNVSEAAVCNIAKGKIWSHVTRYM